MAGTGRMEGDRTSISEEAGAGGGWEERLHPGQARPSQPSLGSGRWAGGWCPVFSAPSVCPQELTQPSTPSGWQVSCPLGSLSMSGGGGWWRKLLQE